MVEWLSQSLKVWMSESLNVWMSWSLDVWKSECLKVWKSESLSVSECVWKCLKVSESVWKCLKVSERVCMSEVWMPKCLNIQKSGCLKVSHESFVFTSSTVGSWRRSPTKASFSHLQLLEVEGGLAQKLRFHIFNCWKLKEVSHTMRFWELADTWNVVFSRTKTCLGWCVGKLVRRTFSEHARLYRDHGRIGRAVELPVQASFCQRFCFCAKFLCDFQFDLSRSQWNWLLRRLFGDTLRVVLLRLATQCLQIVMELIVHESLCQRSCT